MDDLRASLARPIQLAEQLIKWADEAQACRSECQDLRSRIERLSTLLRQAARAELYERPSRRILGDTDRALDKAAALLERCCGRGILHRVFTIIPAGSFKKAAHLLDNSLGDLTWILRVSSYAANDDDDDDEDDHIGLPPIAQNEPILFLIWEQIAVLQYGGLEARADAAASVVSLARDNDRYGKLIIEEDGVPPLLRLIKEGRADAQESAALAIGLLGRDPECVDLMILAGVCTSFVKILKDAPMKVQGMVAWAVSELAANHSKCQDAFLQHNVIRLLVSHLAFETVQEHSKYAVASKMSIHSVVLDKKTNDSSQEPPDVGVQATTSAAKPTVGGGATGAGSSAAVPGPSSAASRPAGIAGTRMHNASMSATSTRGREYEVPEIKAYLKSHAARALGTLATGNPAICKNITESRALLCFSILLEKATGDVQYNSAMALVEICRVAEQHPELRRSAFKPTSPSARAVVDQLLRVVDKADSDDLLVPCITCLGCLSRTFRATEKRVIGPLVRLLDERESEVTLEAASALTKFASTDNYLHVDHCTSIIAHGGAKHLVQHVYFGEQGVQTAALILVCFLAHNVPDSDDLAQAEILTVLDWGLKQGYMSQDPLIESLLPEAKIRMELYQSRVAKGYY
ncbi:uncharacterized protein LOC120678653 [Panicum virgatum]|uniref:DUF7792 domain-containing protein n=1 Tax=Panicum virgatum TaxID=38727 RepID=A0A8T0R5L0_PANVG|nr:uncharacterized protein LOC120678653 [Panicum virgatum]KAG2580540.1 hypothetical protein PVAP13_6NG353500 [Panicum virgatum]KAG2580541.1 hypothetical protein PVAP13_6NG353500 [Panicum virgatum]